MSFPLTSFEKRQIYRSLVLLVKSLENEVVTIDLRNECSVSGKLENVDVNMNLNFQEAALVEYEGSYKYFSSLFVPGRMVRDVIIPSHIPIVKTIVSALPQKPKKSASAKKPMTLKKARALKQQRETKLLVEKFIEEKKTQKADTDSSKPKTV